MMLKRLWFLLFLLLTCCTSGQHIYYWERPNTGGVWFAKDHRDCLNQADYWPYHWKWPWEWSMKESRKYDLRFDNDAGSGIWARFIPMPGAQPVYVNSLYGDSTVSARSYHACMIDKGYKETLPSVTRHQVFQE